MKNKFLAEVKLWTGMAVAAGALMIGWASSAPAATNDASALLQNGLFEEEANHNLDAAITDYLAVVAQTEKDHAYAATAVFRLGECYRKLGRTNDANIQYQRILQDFSDQTELAKLSREYLGPTASSIVTASERSNGEPSAAVIEADELKKMQKMIADNPDLINGDGQGDPPLVRAARDNQLSVAKFLLENKADPNIGNLTTDTPLAVAVANDETEMIELLLSRGADPNIVGRSPIGTEERRDQYAAIHIAALRGYRAAGEILLAHKADPNLRTKSGNTALQFAARKGFLTVVELLLAHGAEVNATGNGGNTAMHDAASAGQTAILEYLISHKGDVNARNNEGWTPLMIAVNASHPDAAKTLLAHGAEVNALATSGDYEGWSALHLAIMKRSTEAAKVLLEHGANTELPIKIIDHAQWADGRMAPPSKTQWPFPVPTSGENYYGQLHPLSYAVLLNSKPIAELLLDHKAKADARDSEGDTALLLAAKRGASEIAELLLGHGAEINAGDANGNTPLRLAVDGNKEKTTVQLLLDHSADVDLVNKDNQTPLLAAAANGRVDLVKSILTHHPKLEVVNKDGLTALEAVILYFNVQNRDQVAGILLDAGADPNGVIPKNWNQHDGWSLLEYAANQLKKELVEMLLAHKANVNYQDPDGGTALSRAKEAIRPSSPMAPGSMGAPPLMSISNPGFPGQPMQIQVGVASQPADDNSPARRSTEIVDLLMKAGANVNLQRQALMTLSRNGVEYTIFTKSTNDWNHFTLFELIADAYSGGARLSFPDLAHIKINRLKNNASSTEEIPVDVEAILKSGDCARNMPLEWGEQIEIPELDHRLNEQWRELPQDMVEALDKCNDRTVQIIVKDQTNSAPFMPHRQAVTPQAARGLPQWPPAPAPLFGAARTPINPDSFRLSHVVRNSGMLLTSSDTSRVRVSRKNSETGQTETQVFNLDKIENTSADLLLKDGDVIEVPEKQ